MLTTDFIHCSGVYVADFEPVNVGWEVPIPRCCSCFKKFLKIHMKTLIIESFFFFTKVACNFAEKEKGRIKEVFCKLWESF